jgi:hypothetical protein
LAPFEDLRLDEAAELGGAATFRQQSALLKHVREAFLHQLVEIGRPDRRQPAVPGATASCPAQAQGAQAPRATRPHGSADELPPPRRFGGSTKRGVPLLHAAAFLSGSELSTPPFQYGRIAIQSVNVEARKRD